MEPTLPLRAGTPGAVSTGTTTVGDRPAVVAEFDLSVRRGALHAADGERRAEQLLRVVVVIAVVKDPAQVLLRLGPPDDLAERDPLPHPHPEGAADVQTRHHLGEPDGVSLSELQETGEVLQISIATVEREWQAARAWLYSRLKGSG